MIYATYAISLMLFVLLYHFETIKKHILKVFSNKETMKEISIGIFTGSLVALISSTNLVHALAFGFLTIVSLVGIINSNS